MRRIRVSTAQFEARDGDKSYNLERIDHLAAEAAGQGAELVCFHECCIPGYTFLETLDRDATAALAERVPGGPSIETLREFAAAHEIAIGAGLIESDGDRLFNTYVVITSEGVQGKFRKIHAFISEHISCGDSYLVFELLGCSIGILICYDCNLVENVRLTVMAGAEIILAPHVTGCLPSPMPGRGVVDKKVWENRELDPVSCRQEFDGPKGRGWLMRWLPARAYENGVFVVYSNPIGVEGGTIKPGGSLILDPYGEVIAECLEFGDQIVTATLDPRKLEDAPGRGYIRARRPELYRAMTEANSDVSPDGQPEVYWKQPRKR